MGEGDQRIEILEEEIKVLKGEVRRTLVDLRALLMRDDSPLSEGAFGRRAALADLASGDEAPVVRRESSESVQQEASLQAVAVPSPVVVAQPQPQQAEQGSPVPALGAGAQAGGNPPGMGVQPGPMWSGPGSQGGAAPGLSEAASTAEAGLVEQQVRLAEQERRIADQERRIAEQDRKLADGDTIASERGPQRSKPDAMDRDEASPTRPIRDEYENVYRHDDTAETPERPSRRGGSRRREQDETEEDERRLKRRTRDEDEDADPDDGAGERRHGPPRKPNPRRRNQDDMNRDEAQAGRPARDEYDNVDDLEEPEDGPKSSLGGTGHRRSGQDAGYQEEAQDDESETPRGSPRRRRHAGEETDGQDLYRQRGRNGHARANYVDNGVDHQVLGSQQDRFDPGDSDGRGSPVFDEYFELLGDDLELEDGVNGAGGLPLDLNLMASLVRWASIAKQRVGEQRLSHVLELYGQSGHLSPRLRELLDYISQMADELPPDKDHTAQVCVDLIAQLHGILTGGLSIAKIRQKKVPGRS